MNLCASHGVCRHLSRFRQVLEESLTGAKCQTVVIACVSPADKDLQQTISTLRYAEGLRPHCTLPSPAAHCFENEPPSPVLRLGG